MEWTWREQILLLLQCGGLGLLLGTVYDWISVWGQLRRLSRAAAFCLDALFGLLAALVMSLLTGRTFFSPSDIVLDYI